MNNKLTEREKLMVDLQKAYNNLRKFNDSTISKFFTYPCILEWMIRIVETINTENVSRETQSNIVELPIDDLIEIRESIEDAHAHVSYNSKVFNKLDSALDKLLQLEVRHNEKNNSPKQER